MVATTKQQEPGMAQSAAGKATSPAQAAGGAMKKELRGMTSYDAQAARLAPDAKPAAAQDTKQAAPAPASTSFGDLDPGNRLAGLHPTFADSVKKVASIARGKGLDVFVAQGMRTIAEQNALYAQGRTKKGPVVTWVRGGSSYHNYGLGADFAFHGGQPYSEKHDWKGLVASVREAGLVSGASYGDRPHANLDIPMKSLQAWHKKGGMRHVWDQVSEQVGGPRFGGDGAEDKVDDTKGPQSGGAKSGTYTVRAGDTLIDIAQRLLGDEARWHELAELNGIRDARELAVGRVLRLPTGAATKKQPDAADVGSETQFKQRSHVVRAGETLSQISLRYYGMGSMWQAIATANGIADPSKLDVGQKLVIPAQGAAKTSAGAARKVVPAHHVVARGETLGEIADTYYGSWARWTDIAKANRISDPRSLKVGQKLVLPQ
ncbi:MAG: LysM peptidoglycan-binding domain-containing protein [Deltaproteobacteria bacterium]|nr:LysM peptidoglycan-binding domain-containing protein [Deltaproteobacteria bacterium]